MEEQNYNSLKNETGGQKEIETKEIKSFKSFLKFCWRSKIVRRSIKLGIVILFVGFFISATFIGNPGTTNLGAAYGGILLILTPIISSLVIIIGTWWGTRKMKIIPSLRFLFTIGMIIISAGCFIGFLLFLVWLINPMNL